MKKALILIVSLIVISLATILLIKATNSTNDLDYYSHTKAICNETNYCQDYYISCKGDKVLLKMPITGAVAQYDSYWEDPRNESTRDILCK